MAIEHQVLMQDSAVATGNGTELTVAGHSVAVLQASGTFEATITFEAAVDGGNWIAVQATNLTSGTAATTATAAGLYRITVAGLRVLRARISEYTSGSVIVVGRTSSLGT